MLSPTDKDIDELTKCIHLYNCPTGKTITHNTNTQTFPKLSPRSFPCKSLPKRQSFIPGDNCVSFNARSYISTTTVLNEQLSMNMSGQNWVHLYNCPFSCFGK